MNLFLNRLVAFFMSLLTFLPWNMLEVKNNAKKFRIVTYAVASNYMNEDNIDPSHFSQITDVIFFGMSNFNEQGEVVLSDDFETALGNLRKAIGDNDVNLYLNLIGPGSQINSDDWYENIADMSKHHNNAFRSGVLEKNILSVLEKYEFDGIFFDYEYPYAKEDWKVFDEFLISLDKELGDKYKLGCAISGWMTQQSRAAIRVLDMVEVMAYDFWDDDGTHSSVTLTKCCIAEMIKDGYSLSQMDLGIPLYGRPTNKGAYWYGYGPYADMVDEKGFVYLSDVDLTFSFNTYDVVYEKTEWAIKSGLGGVMSWHCSCDAPASNEKSLFNAMYNAKQDLQK